MFGLEFDTYGTGPTHALRWSEVVGVVCPKCNGVKTVGPPTFPCTCPLCIGTGKVLQRPEAANA